MRLLSRVCTLALVVTTVTFGAFAASPTVANAAQSVAVANVSGTTTATVPASFNAAGVNIWSGGSSTTSWNVADVAWDTGVQSTSQTTSIPGGANFRFDSSRCNSNLLDCFSHPGNYVGFDTQYKTVGFAANAHTNGHITFSGRASNLQTNTGTGISYPGSASFTYPNARSFSAGQTVSLVGTWALGSGAAVSAGTTSGNFDFTGNFGLGGGADVTTYLAYTSPGGAIIPGFNWSSGDATLFSLSPFDDTPRCCPLTPISGDLKSLSVTPGTQTVNTDGSVTASGTNRFSDVTFNLGGIVTTLARGAVPALSRNVDGNSIGVPIQVGYNIFDARSPVQLYADQSLTFRHDGVRIRLAFSRPMAGFSGPYLAADPGRSWVEFRPGANVSVQTPSGDSSDITVTPTITLDNARLTNNTVMRTTGEVDLSSGGFDFSLPGFEVFPRIGGFDTGLAYPENVAVGFECDLWILGRCVFGHPTVSIVWHEIYVPSFGPWGFGGLSAHWGPLWGPRAYGNSTTPNTLSNDTQSVNMGQLTLASFLLQPNRPPVARITGNAPVVEGSLLGLSGATSSDPDGDPITYAWSFGDGTIAAGPNGAHVYADSGTYAVTLTVTDSSGLTGTATTPVVVSNAAPTLDLPPDQAVSEGSIVTVGPVAFNDKGTRDTHTATISWGDGTPTTPLAVSESPFGPPGSTSGANGTIAAASHVYADAGLYHVVVCVRDDDGATTCVSPSITVTNVAPTVTAAGPQVIDEGSPLAVTAALFNDKGTLDTHTATIDWGDGTAPAAGTVHETPFGPPGLTAGANGSVTATHVYDDNGSYVARVCVSDDDGATTCANFSTTVLNVPPTAHLRGGPVVEHWGVPIGFTADITDPSNADMAAGFANHWRWGDGTPDLTDHSLTPAQAVHTYEHPGGYTLGYDATDKDGGRDARSMDSKVITIVRRPTTISCTVANAIFGYTSALSATLVDTVNAANARLLGRGLTFTTGAYTWTAASDAAGLATSRTPTQPADGSIPPLLPGAHTITVSFAGDENYLGSTATCDYTVASSGGTVQGQTQQGPAGSLGQVHIQVTGAYGAPAGEVFFKIGKPWVMRAFIVTGLGIAPDERTAWISGRASDGRGFVLYAEDNGPRAASVAKLWIGGVLQNGDGVAVNGQVHIE